MRDNFFFCSCGKRLLKFGTGYEDHIASGEHDQRKHEEARRKASRSPEQIRRDGAADSMDVLGSGL